MFHSAPTTSILKCDFISQLADRYQKNIFRDTDKRTALGNFPKRRSFCSYCLRRIDYPAQIALTGQVSTQAPQSMQVSPSMARLSPASLIAFTGQESSHAPQLMHSSEIL